MSKVTEISSIALWLLGHALFTIITICTVRGAWAFHQDYQSYIAKIEAAKTTIDISQLSDESKEKLASALIEDGFSVPRNVEGSKNKKG